ncbi:MAG: hypothetical protein KKD39_01745 [Candidatus Altiarchaeota archaeon]|nr:hypothetical protein [Candidatus Altiarchaeota archaeon]
MPKFPDLCGVKHMRHPPNTDGKQRYILSPDYKAIYLFGDPVTSVISLFRRFSFKSICTQLDVDSCRCPDNMRLDEYALKGEDILGLKAHFDSWAKCNQDERSYPIMLLRYDGLWESLGDVFDFVGLNKDKIDSFPEKQDRVSKDYSIDEDTLKLLKDTYSDLTDDIAGYPLVKII